MFLPITELDWLILSLGILPIYYEKDWPLIHIFCHIYPFSIAPGTHLPQSSGLKLHKLF